MWFGTEDGLNKYDGYKFTIYNHDRNNPYSLSHNNVRSIYEDKDSVLWIGTKNGGLNKLNRETGQFSHFLHDPNNPNSLSNNIVFSVFESHFADRNVV